jgi:hypothetical protein
MASDKYVKVFYSNGSNAPATLSSIAESGDVEGISNNITPPYTVVARTSLGVVFTITVDGPLVFEAIYDFLSVASYDPQLILFGTRAPQLSGAIGYLFMPHDWSNGLTEEMAWKTDVLIAFDRTEQRIA